jgi:DNA-binding GntR family transcriptional regulator
LGKVRRETMVERGVAILRAQILGYELAPGTPVTEEAMAHDLGVSRPTMREVLNTLMLQGLLIRDPKTRILEVTTLDPEQVREIYRARRVLELAGVDAAALLDDGELRELEAAVDDMASAARAADVAALVAADSRSHTCTVGFLHSRYLSEMHNGLMTRLNLAFNQVETSDSRDDAELVRKHREYCDLVLARDTAAAKASLLARLDEAEQLVLASAFVARAGG